MLSCLIRKKISPFTIDMNIEIEASQILVILGQSGCGKTSLLNLITGFLTPDEGIIVNKKHVFYNQTINEPIYKRKIGYIQQDSCLFPHMTVEENLCYAVNKKKQKGYEKNLEKLIQYLDIKDNLNQYPHELSGGQQQRVAIGRALMMEPEIILWDEPFSSLDYSIRQDLRELVITIRDAYDIPMIFVTHDLREAYTLGDKIAIMKDGQIIQQGDKYEVFKHPSNEEVAKIVGMTNVIKAESIKNTSRCQVGDMKLSTLNRIKESKSIMIGIRPEDIVYVREIYTSKDISNMNVSISTVLSMRHELDYYTLKVLSHEMNEVLEIILPKYVIDKYQIAEGKKIKIMLKYKEIAVLGV